MLARRVLAALLLASRADALSTASVLRKISPLHVDRYEREGVVVVRGLIDADAVELLRREVDGAVAEPGPHAEDLAPGGTGKSYFTDLELSTRRPALRDFAAEGSAACAAALLMRSRTSTFLYDQLFVKHARDPAAAAAATVFHQDAPYWSVEGSQIASVSIALDDVDERDCLDFLPGTHRLPEFQPVHFASGEPYESESPLPTLDVAALGGPRARFDLSPGDAVVFDGRTVHGGAGSFGRALVLRFVGDDVVFSRARFDSGRTAIPTRDPGLADGARLADHDDYPVCYVDPFFGKRGVSPVSVLEWSKGKAVNEERGDFS